MRNFLLRGKLLFFLWDLGTLEGQFRRIFTPVQDSSSKKKWLGKKRMSEGIETIFKASFASFYLTK